jgi:hypothetical protein
MCKCGRNWGGGSQAPVERGLVLGGRVTPVWMAPGPESVKETSRG